MTETFRQKGTLPPGFLVPVRDGETDEFFVNLGPQHPATHGALRLVVRLDGETVREVVPHMGYIHRGIEYQAERCSALQSILFSDRFDYHTAHMNNHCVCMAIERALGIGVPERGEYVRVIVDELTRVSSHLIFLGSFGTDLGGTTCFLYAFKMREAITQVFDELCGARLTMNFYRPGGSSADVPESFEGSVRNAVKTVREGMKEWNDFLTGNVIFQERTRGVGILSAERAIALGCSGPVLRGSGVEFDVRRKNPYGIYDRFDFDVPVGSVGDVWDRYMVRVEEIEQSLRIVEQALASFPAGPWRSKERVSWRLPEGSWYAEAETAKGTLGVFLEGTGKSDKPWRIKVRSPSFSNLMALDEMCRGGKVADVVACLGSIDPVIPEVDR